MDVQFDFRDGVAVVMLNRPQVLNALSFSVLQTLDSIFDEVGKSKARALIVTGAGEKSFCAGADIAELMHRGLTQQKQGAGSADRGRPVHARLSNGGRRRGNEGFR